MIKSHSVKTALQPASPFSRERILVTGITGIHGWPVYRTLSDTFPSEQLFGIGPPRMKKPAGNNIAACCISDTERLHTIREEFNPTLVIHAAGVCDLDVCEDRPHWAHRINVDGSCAVVEAFSPTARICYLSTDLVFSGNNPPRGGYAEQHVPEPVSVAGRTFLGGEQAVTTAHEWSIIRLGLPIGTSINGDKGGLDWIKGRFRRNRPVTLFTDEYRSIISCEDLARCVAEFAASGKQGLYHLGGTRAVSLHALGTMIIQNGGYTPTLLKGITRSQERDGPPRIGNVALNSEKIAGVVSQPAGTWNPEKTYSG